MILLFILRCCQVLLAHLLPFFKKPTISTALPRISADDFVISMSNTRGFCNKVKQAYYLKISKLLKLDIFFVVDVNMKKSNRCCLAA
ncbi:hypothetical protein DSO57_1000164 [Entomophthora muscae]|uniref:Uncharacterized protein n=1 Tax=Entomophthora muscae TaxID=34485 RepID=A0ACC2T9C5_9FUNG|nr:hypothetical protein DSO57_1000164 [Entomophthora muscae]